MITDHQLLLYSNTGNWQKFTTEQRRKMLNDAIRSLVTFKYVGDFGEKLLVFYGLASDCRTITQKGEDYYNSL